MKYDINIVLYLFGYLYFIDLIKIEFFKTVFSYTWDFFYGHKIPKSTLEAVQANRRTLSQLKNYF
jgi:hypothetical protein